MSLNKAASSGTRVNVKKRLITFHQGRSMRATPLAMTRRNSKNISLARFYASPKMPKKRKRSSLEETPMHGRLASTLPFTSAAVYRDFAFVATANKVKNMFLWRSLPLRILGFFKMPMVGKAYFRNVADKGKEVEMYGPLVRVLRSVMKMDTHGA